jgi:hypothetical protein
MDQNKTEPAKQLLKRARSGVAGIFIYRQDAQDSARQARTARNRAGAKRSSQADPSSCDDLILKQNTVCFALPLCRKYRQRERAVSIANGGNVQLENIRRRETVMVVAVLSAANVERHRAGAAERPVAGPQSD